MTKKDFEILYNNRGIKIIGYIFITVFLGAIGSGFWERVLSKWFEYMSTALMRLLSKLFTGYTDMLYSRVGMAQTDNLTVLPYIFLIMTLISIQWILLNIVVDKLNKLVKPDSDDNDDETVAEFVSKAKKKIYRVMIPMCVITTVVILHLAINDIYTREACTYIERSIDILSPQLSEYELRSLRSSYRAIDNANKFYGLDDKLRLYAKSKNITLPKFTVIK